jgi:hypothetical protein
LRGSLSNGKAGEYLHIRYANVVPGFFNAYRTFHNLQELEAMVKAHLYLYGLMASVVEGAIEKVMQ